MLLSDSSAKGFPGSVAQVVPPFVSIPNTVQAAQIHVMPTMRAFGFRQAAKSPFLTAVKTGDILLERSRFCAFIVEARLEFHVPEPSILKSIELLIYTLVCSTEFHFQALDFCDVLYHRSRVRGRHV